MTRYGRSLWIDRFPRSRVPSYPHHKGRLQTDVVIVGGGLTGCATAYAFAAAGVRVVLVEADRIGQGMSGLSTGWIADTPGTSFRRVGDVLGLRASRRAWQAWRRAALDFSALVRRLRVRCDATPATSLIVARSAEKAQAVLRDAKARKAAGLDGVLLNARAASSETGVPAAGAIRTRDGTTIDPYKASLGLIGAASARGALVFERSTVTKVRFGSKAVDVQIGDGVIEAGRVIVATGRPTALFRSLVRHVRSHSVFAAVTEPLPARTRRSIGEPGRVLLDSAEPPHLIRWVDGDRLLVAGADSPAVSDRLRDKTIVQRTGQLMYELSTIYPEISGIPPAYGWEARYGRTRDDLPYIGPHRNFPRHLFAFGCASHSVTDAYLASRVLLRHYLEQTDPADEVFGFTTDRL
jgi:glycine/D-amino acid oxidase-like deaminating enzyme